MMYTQREDLAARGQQRLWSILTVANVGGGGIGATLGWQLARLVWSSWLGMTVLIVGCALTGLVLTMRWTGLSLLDRLTLRVLGGLNRVQGRHRVVPHTTTGRRVAAPDAVTVVRDGRVVVRPYTPIGTEGGME